jgi:hypothetical protein
MTNGINRIEHKNPNLEFTDDEQSSSPLCEEMRTTFGALRQLTKEVKDILLVTNRELNEAALWNLGHQWIDSYESAKRPADSRTLMQKGKQSFSGSIGRSGGRSPR